MLARKRGVRPTRDADVKHRMPRRGAYFDRRVRRAARRRRRTAQPAQCVARVVAVGQAQHRAPADPRNQQHAAARPRRKIDVDHRPGSSPRYRQLNPVYVARHHGPRSQQKARGPVMHLPRPRLHGRIVRRLDQRRLRKCDGRYGEERPEHAKSIHESPSRRIARGSMQYLRDCGRDYPLGDYGRSTDYRG